MCPGAKIFVASSADEKVTAVFAEKETELQPSKVDLGNSRTHKGVPS